MADMITKRNVANWAAGPMKPKVYHGADNYYNGLYGELHGGSSAQGTNITYNTDGSVATFTYPGSPAHTQLTFRFAHGAVGKRYAVRWRVSNIVGTPGAVGTGNWVAGVFGDNHTMVIPPSRSIGHLDGYDGEGDYVMLFDCTTAADIFIRFGMGVGANPQTGAGPTSYDISNISVHSIPTSVNDHCYEHWNGAGSPDEDASDTWRVSAHGQDFVALKYNRTGSMDIAASGKIENETYGGMLSERDDSIICVIGDSLTACSDFFGGLRSWNRQIVDQGNLANEVWAGPSFYGHTVGGYSCSAFYGDISVDEDKKLPWLQSILDYPHKFGACAARTVYISLGTNDTWGGPSNGGQTGAQLALTFYAVSDTIIKQKRRVMTGGPMPFHDSDYTETGNPYGVDPPNEGTAEANAFYGAIGTWMGLINTDPSNIVVGARPTYMTEENDGTGWTLNTGYDGGDGLHWNETGHMVQVFVSGSAFSTQFITDWVERQSDLDHFTGGCTINQTTGPQIGVGI